jgi:hypothetical protein
MGNRTNSPLLGYNTNVKHAGHLFHIQTEDSGLDHPHVITHLFTSGTILATKKSSYAELVGAQDWEERVRQMMKDQHKAMFVDLRDGAHDAIAARILGVPVGAAAPDGSAAPPQRPEESEPDAVVEDAEARPTIAEIASAAGVRVIAPAAMAGSAPAHRDSRAHAAGPAPGGRSIFETPDAVGSFGESLISDKSLDEVILTYLKDELDE